MRNKIKHYLLSFTDFASYKELLYKYCNYLDDKRVTYDSFTDKKNAIMVFVIRCNERISDNTAIRNNDLLVVVEYISLDNYNVYTFNVTADPKSKQANIAHLIEQVYTGNVRPHRWIAGRLAICSDKGCWYRRTNSKGEGYEAKFGQIGINIHDTGGFWNSSLGCVILESDSDYKNVFKPLLKRVSNSNSIPVAVINQDYFTDELKAIQI